MFELIGSWNIYDLLVPDFNETTEDITRSFLNIGKYINNHYYNFNFDIAFLTNSDYNSQFYNLDDFPLCNTIKSYINLCLDFETKYYLTSFENPKQMIYQLFKRIMDANNSDSIDMYSQMTEDPIIKQILNQASTSNYLYF